MAIDLGDVRARLATLLGEITGVQSAFGYTPRGVEQAHCPLWLIQPAEALYELPLWDGSVAVCETVRRWRLILLLGKAAEGAYGDLESQFEPFFERLEDEMVDNLKLNALSGVVSSYLDTDVGLVTVEYPPGGGDRARWFGCEWSLLVGTRLDVSIPGSLASGGSDVRGRLAAILATVSGVTAAFEFSPRGVEVADAPLFLVYEAEAEHGAPYAGGHGPLRLWRLLLLAGKAAQGAYGDLEQVLDPFFEEVPKTLAAYLTLNDLSGVVNAVLVDDSGPGRVEFPPGSGDEWVGCEWGLAVETKRDVTVGL